MTSHTPTPWRVTSNDGWPQFDNLIEGDKDGVACVFESADAAFIVRAVNAHDDLVRALERIAAGDVTNVQFAALAVAEARAALAKAKGGEAP